MAKCLNTFIGEYIHINQSGFIPSQQISDNIHKTFNVIYYCDSNKLPALFDKLETSYLQLLLHFMGFGPCFLQAIKTLYTAPVVQLSINNFHSEDFFLLSGGTCQGCPLSPILFAIFLEPLALAIRNNPTITGVSIGSHSHKFSLFSNDTVVYLTNPITFLPLLIQEINSFGFVSVFTINYEKSEL